MKFQQANAEVFVPDGKAPAEALKRTTHLAVGAHQDDIEILAAQPIVECMHGAGKWLSAVTCTDGSGSPRAGAFASLTNEQMQELRWQEQRNAAVVGRYAAMVQLKYGSAAVKDPKNTTVEDDLRRVLEFAHPSVVFTHNLADKHDTHLGVVVKTLQALRTLPKERRPGKVEGVEIWRNLDWMPDKEKVVMDVTGGDHIAAALLGVFDSQIAGGKRYDLATLGRWRANATYSESHGVDTCQFCSFGMDLTPLVNDEKMDFVDYALSYIDKFREDVRGRLGKTSGK